MGGGDSTLGGLGVKGYTTGESGVGWWFSTVGTGVSGRFLSMMVAGVI